jgi:ribosome biogenesis GTPase
VTLTDLGWDDRWAAAFEPFAGAGLVPGRVVLEHNHVCRVVTAQGERLAEVGGRLKHRASGRPDLPTAGDWIALPPESAGERSLIRDVLPRRTFLSRKAPGRQTEEQVVAANLDRVFVVFGLDVPVKPRSIERYLVLARRGRIEPVIVLNKSDLAVDLDAARAVADASAGDVPVLVISARIDPELAPLQAMLTRGRTVALLGPSGAGKSSIVNRLIGREVLPTGDVRPWDARGRHTSVHRQLVVREAGGVIIDTPGIRELQIWEPDAALEEAFDDVAALAGGCRFRDCRHDREPGCAVRGAVDAGSLDPGRYEHFLKLQSERHALETLRVERERADAKRQQKTIHKALRDFQKSRDRDR